MHRYAFLLLIIPVFSCKKDASSSSSANLIFKFRFDSLQARLDNTGQPAAMPAGHAGLSPQFNSMSAHYIELAPQAFTALGQGTVLYHAPETTAGGGTAIDFSKSTVAKDGETFFTIPLKNVAPGSYEWLRVSLAYQNYNVQYHLDTVVSGIDFTGDYTGAVASYIGFNTYISSMKIKDNSIAVNANKKQGFWGFETTINVSGMNFENITSGQSPEGATTVPNPLSATSPIPQGSCVVTAAFAPGKLTITGNESKDIVVEVSLSTNKSFEWLDLIPDSKWEPSKGEQVVDMGIRGMIPSIQ
jgi:hypothetical protein